MPKTYGEWVNDAVREEPGGERIVITLGYQDTPRKIDRVLQVLFQQDMHVELVNMDPDDVADVIRAGSE